jgi:hypothetical protein
MVAARSIAARSGSGASGFLAGMDAHVLVPRPESHGEQLVGERVYWLGGLEAQCHVG